MHRVSVLSHARPAAVTVAALCWAGSAQAQTLVEVWRLGGLASPESVLFDEAVGWVVVSQMGTFGPEAGADGSLALISPEGEMLDDVWVTGLIDPKGMGSHEGRLYVADADGLHVFDMETGEPSGIIELPESVFLNDVAVGDDGAIYVSDMMAGGIYRLQGDTVDLVAAAGSVSLPNGLLAQGGGLLVGSFGEGLAEDVSVETPGGLMTLDAATGTMTPVAGTETSASVDGIAMLGDWVIYDDYQTGRILGWRDGTLVTLAETAPTAADLDLAGDLLLVPVTAAGEVIAFRLEE
jgi:hypothetical protein